MTLFEIYSLIEYITNKDYEGNMFTPEQFVDLCKVANMDLFKVKMGLPEDYRPGAPYPRQHIDVTQLHTDDLKFLKDSEVLTLTDGLGDYPTDYFTFDTLRHDYQRDVDGEATTIPRAIEILTEPELSMRLGNWTKQPTTWNPVCVIRNDGIQVYPITINQATLYYYRYPIEPVFEYDLEEGYITYNESGSTEFEWPEHLHMDLVRIILGYVGINIRDQLVLQYAEQKKAEGV